MGRWAPGNMAALADRRTAMKALTGPATATWWAVGPAHPAQPAHPARPRSVAHQVAMLRAAALTVSPPGTVAGPAAVVARPAAAAVVVGPARSLTTVAPVAVPAAPVAPVPGMPRVPASQPLWGRRCRWHPLPPWCRALRR